MSIRHRLVHEVAEIARRMEIVADSRKRIRVHLNQFIKFLLYLEIRPQRIKDIPQETLSFYAQYCLARGLEVRTVNNMICSIRMILKHAGRPCALFSSDLGIPRGDRSGKKIPLSPHELQHALHHAQKVDRGFYLLLRMQNLLGLRMLEAMQCCKSLCLWREQIKAGAHFVTLSFGAKNGRARDISIIPQHRQELLETIDFAISYCERNDGQLINARVNNKEGSLNRLKALYQRAGLTGEKSSHALRYGYACRSADARLATGEDEWTVLGEVAEDLGHGAEKRKGFIIRTYLRSIGDQFPNAFRDGHYRSPPKKSDSTTVDPDPPAPNRITPRTTTIHPAYAAEDAQRVTTHNRSEPRKTHD